MKGVGCRSLTVACSDGGARIPVTLVLLNISRDGIHGERSENAYSPAAYTVPYRETSATGAEQDGGCA